MQKILFQTLRVLHFSGGFLLLVGELSRRWDNWPYWAFWMDDVIFGSLAMVAAVLAAPNVIWRRALFSVSHGIGMGMLYGSFFGKIGNPDYVETGNSSAETVVMVIGTAFAFSIIGAILSVVLFPQGWQQTK